MFETSRARRRLRPRLRLRPRPRSRMKAQQEERPPRSFQKTKLMTSVVLFLLTLSWLPQSGNAQQPLLRRVSKKQHQKHRPQPSKCIESESELLGAIREYYAQGLSNKRDSPSAQTYGWSIQKWCLSSDVLEKWGGSDDTTSEENISMVVKDIVDTHDDDGIEDLEANDWTSDWSQSTTNTRCMDLCASAAEEENVSGNDHVEEERNDDQVGYDSYVEGTGTNTKDQEDPSSDSDTRNPRNSTTTSMLVRLIPLKLVVVLSLMCLTLGIRQMCLSVDADSGCCCCCKWINSLFGSRYASYEGIDPSDVSDHQKGVEFELLQLAASGEVGSDDTEVVVIS
mmetsp:Transcript_3382/g.7278  ORF Transcript_3382/g.7278 Transcript_3382/m.7278 type:complete len:339 (-) Transcript_3382:566-1582(-)